MWLLLALPAWAEVAFELPAGEDAGDWTTALAMAGFSPGAAGAAPSVRARAEAGRWRLDIVDERGGAHVVWVDVPDSPPEREGVALLAESVVHPLARPALPAPPSPPPRRAASTAARTGTTSPTAAVTPPTPRAPVDTAPPEPAAAPEPVPVDVVEPSAKVPEVPPAAPQVAVASPAPPDTAPSTSPVRLRPGVGLGVVARPGLAPAGALSVQVVRAPPTGLRFGASASASTPQALPPVGTDAWCWRSEVGVALGWQVRGFALGAEAGASLLEFRGPDGLAGRALLPFAGLEIGFERCFSPVCLRPALEVQRELGAVDLWLDGTRRGALSPWVWGLHLTVATE